MDTHLLPTACPTRMDQGIFNTTRPNTHMSFIPDLSILEGGGSYSPYLACDSSVENIMGDNQTSDPFNTMPPLTTSEVSFDRTSKLHLNSWHDSGKSSFQDSLQAGYVSGLPVEEDFEMGNTWTGSSPSNFFSQHGVFHDTSKQSDTVNNLSPMCPSPSKFPITPRNYPFSSSSPFSRSASIRGGFNGQTISLTTRSRHGASQGTYSSNSRGISTFSIPPAQELLARNSSSSVMVTNNSDDHFLAISIGKDVSPPSCSIDNGSLLSPVKQQGE
jgi:hypothetical protein